MEEGNKNSDLLDKLILEALEQQPEEAIPAGFTNRLISRWERKLALKELLTEFGLKTALVIGSLITLAGFLFFPFKDVFPLWLKLASNHWQIITGAALVILITFFIDQVVLRLYSETE